MKWWLTCMKKYFDFSGRARRKEFWMFFLFNIIFLFVAFVLDNVIVLISEDPSNEFLTYLFLLAIVIPTMSVTARRLHDIGKSSWWMLITFFPFIGEIWLFLLMVTDSQPGDNKYGVNPKLNG